MALHRSSVLYMKTRGKESHETEKVWGWSCSSAATMQFVCADMPVSPETGTTMDSVRVRRIIHPDSLWCMERLELNRKEQFHSGCAWKSEQLRAGINVKERRSEMTGTTEEQSMHWDSFRTWILINHWTLTMLMRWMKLNTVYTVVTETIIFYYYYYFCKVVLGF